MESREIFFIKRRRGRVLLYHGREYYKHTTYKSGNSIWRCSLYKTQHCTGTVTLSKSRYASPGTPLTVTGGGAFPAIPNFAAPIVSLKRPSLV